MQEQPNLKIPDVSTLAAKLRDIKDFPKPGIVFKDVTPLLADSAALSLAVELLTQPFRSLHIDKVVGAESRGFIFGTAVARNLSAGFVPIRKPGKLPYKSVSQSYDLEYGKDRIEIHVDAVSHGQRVLLVDDVLATGGTMDAAVKLVRQVGGRVAATCFVIELLFLNGRKRLGDVPVHSLVKY